MTSVINFRLETDQFEIWEAHMTRIYRNQIFTKIVNSNEVIHSCIMAQMMLFIVMINLHKDIQSDPRRHVWVTKQSAIILSHASPMKHQQHLCLTNAASPQRSASVKMLRGASQHLEQNFTIKQSDSLETCYWFWPLNYTNCALKSHHFIIR